MRLFALEPAIKRYPWGSPIAIPSLFGWSSDGSPIAELWYGDHSRAPATAFDADGPRPLDAMLASDPTLGGRLRFLLKVIGAAVPLSLQCHPDDAQAAAGFAAETERGIPLDSEARAFTDERGKSELVVALGRFQLLAGLRDAADIRKQFAKAKIRMLDDLLPRDDAGVPGFVTALLRLERMRCAAALAEIRRGKFDDAHRPSRWVARLIERYPDDPATLAPLFLHHLELAAGDALHIAPRRLHVYLGGLALELTGPSDNVLRAGLTGKHVHLDALLEMADLRPSPPVPIAAVAQGRGRRYAPAGAGLALEVVDVDGTLELSDQGEVEILVGLGGYVTVTCQGEELELGGGDGIFRARGGGYRLAGRGRIAIGSAATT
jgi:mannose-6-phosphate isomerase